MPNMEKDKESLKIHIREIFKQVCKCCRGLAVSSGGFWLEYDAEDSRIILPLKRASFSNLKDEDNDDNDDEPIPLRKKTTALLFFA
jgi:hypothetical protein